jgi:hypothetical protein
MAGQVGAVFFDILQISGCSQAGRGDARQAVFHASERGFCLKKP